MLELNKLERSMAILMLGEYDKQYTVAGCIAQVKKNTSVIAAKMFEEFPLMGKKAYLHRFCIWSALCMIGLQAKTKQWQLEEMLVSYDFENESGAKEQWLAMRADFLKSQEEKIGNAEVWKYCRGGVEEILEKVDSLMEEFGYPTKMIGNQWGLAIVTYRKLLLCCMNG